MSISAKEPRLEPVRFEISEGLPTVKVNGEQGNIAGLFDALKEIVKEQDSCISLDFEDVSQLHPIALEQLAEFANVVCEKNYRVRLNQPGENISKTLDKLLLKDAFCMSCDKQCEVPCDKTDTCCRVEYFSLAPELRNGRVARKRVDSLAQCLGYDAEVRGDIQIAVGEAFINAVEYGGNGSDYSVNVSCLAMPHKLCITVADEGAGFDVEEIRDSSADISEENGRGLACIDAVMDDVYYNFESGTTICMTKYI